MARPHQSILGQELVSRLGELLNRVRVEFTHRQDEIPSAECNNRRVHLLQEVKGGNKVFASTIRTLAVGCTAVAPWMVTGRGRTALRSTTLRGHFFATWGNWQECELGPSDGFAETEIQSVEN